jgi:hypothetical protein
MASKWPPVRGEAYDFPVAFFAQSDNQIKKNVTLATGDVKISKDYGAFANLATLPSESPSGSGQVKVDPSSDEMTADVITIQFIDAAGAEWHSFSVTLFPTAQTQDAIGSNVVAILTDTAEIGAAGAGLTAADDAILAAIGALNNLSSAGAQAAAAAALAAYDAATGADVGGIPIPSAAAVADAVWDEVLADHDAAGSTGEALGNVGGGGGASAADIWAHATRTLTAATVAGPSAEIDGGAITAYRGDSLSVSLTGLGNITARTKLWFTAKGRKSAADSQSELQVIEGTGLTYVAGAEAQTPANGALTVTNATTGAVTLTFAAAETAKMTREGTLFWDVQMLTASGVTTLATGTLTFAADVTRATS